MQIVAGLHAAHTTQIVHRDLKPENVFLDERSGDPTVKIVDFGFAEDLSMARANRLTRPGKVCGTPQYMSPEQVRGERLDHRSDLFSVGIMLYEVLTARHPFAASTAIELQTNILREEARPVRRRRPSISPDLENLVAALLSKDPATRPQSAYEVHLHLSRIAAAAAAEVLDADDDAPSSTTSAWIPVSTSPSA